MVSHIRAVDTVLTSASSSNGTENIAHRTHTPNKCHLVAQLNHFASIFEKKKKKNGTAVVVFVGLLFSERWYRKVENVVIIAALIERGEAP